MEPTKTLICVFFVIIILSYASFRFIIMQGRGLQKLYEQEKARIFGIKKVKYPTESSIITFKVIVRQLETKKENQSELKVNSKKVNGTKYILLWKLSPSMPPFLFMDHGQEVLKEKKCPFTNCFITDNEYYLGNYTEFDVISFLGSDVDMVSPKDLPAWRAPHQKYVFTNAGAKHNHPIFHINFNNFFNWTWTYRLDSDMRWDYIVIRDSKGKIIGPEKEMHWLKQEDMDPLSNDLKESLRGKSKAAAWFLSDCDVSKHDKMAVRALQQHLSLYELSIDIYGPCTMMKCGNSDECNKMIERDYYFYLAFEDAFCEDYVTEQLLHALQHNAVPIVFGGANYTRFMPEDIYLDAVKTKPAELAEKMNGLMKDINKYAEYFRWKKHYSYHAKNESVDTDNYCSMCALLNDEEKMKKKTTHTDFTGWWNAGFYSLCATLKDNTLLSDTYNESYKCHSFKFSD